MESGDHPLHVASPTSAPDGIAGYRVNGTWLCPNCFHERAGKVFPANIADPIKRSQVAERCSEYADDDCHACGQCILFLDTVRQSLTGE